MDLVDSVVDGALDLHQHLGPSVLPRDLDVAEATIEAQEAGLKAITAKDHHVPTMALADLVQKHFVKKPGFKVFSGIALNNHIGGLNLEALETAINMGARFVWMPTVSTENHHIKHTKGGLKFPTAKKVSAVQHEYIPLVKEDGSPTDDVLRVLEFVAQYQQVVLSTGHGNAQEVDAIVKAAAGLGVKHIIVNHPAYMIGATIEQMKAWAKLGAYLEIGAATSDPASKFCAVDMSTTLRIIREVGVDHIIMNSDCGQLGNIRPVAAIKHFSRLLLDNGVTVRELETMLKTNPRTVMEMED
ncbi:MAG TPA: hypothetical protein GXX40_08030 [Firmicutes bacterium]|nr:hypothetical protein [Bacillota bacterium]